jgi:hypothetical protein
MKYKLTLEWDISYESWQLRVAPLLLENWPVIQEIYKKNWRDCFQQLTDTGDDIKHTSAYMYKILKDERHGHDFGQWDYYIKRTYFC